MAKKGTRKQTLELTHPQLAKEWHPTKNGDLTPQDITFGSYKKVWWICGQGHEWPTRITQRARGSRCPYCSGRYPIKGETDLATTHPELIKEWHPTKNGDLIPQDVSSGSSKEIWWQCPKNHEWVATPNNRKKGSGCPYCSGRYPVKGENDLATTHPELIKEWHPTRNRRLTPQDVSAGSARKVWWQCSKGHEWRANPNNRTNGTGCRKCNTKK